MSAAARTPLIKIEISKGKKRRLYLVSRDAAKAVETLLDQLEGNDELSTPAEIIFPELADPAKTPGIALRGVRLRLGLTQKEMAHKIGVSQGDISKMEKGSRVIGRNLAKRIGRRLGIDYRRFL